MPKRITNRFLQCVYILLMTGTTLPAWADTYAGVVVRVADGDTVTVLDSLKREHKVRLAGIDAPEKTQPFGQVSKQHLARLVFRKPVSVQYEKTDRYRREVGKVSVAGHDANLEQLNAGLAWHYKAYEKEQSPSDRDAYALAENTAKAARRGLWRDLNPTPPWDYRKSKSRSG